MKEVFCKMKMYEDDAQDDYECFYTKMVMITKEKTINSIDSCAII